MILMFTVNSYNDGGKPRASGDDPAVNKHEKFIYL